MMMMIIQSSSLKFAIICYQSTNHSIQLLTLWREKKFKKKVIFLKKWKKHSNWQGRIDDWLNFKFSQKQNTLKKKDFLINWNNIHTLRYYCCDNLVLLKFDSLKKQNKIIFVLCFVFPFLFPKNDVS